MQCNQDALFIHCPMILQPCCSLHFFWLHSQHLSLLFCLFFFDTKGGLVLMWKIAFCPFLTFRSNLAISYLPQILECSFWMFRTLLLAWCSLPWGQPPWKSAGRNLTVIKKYKDTVCNTSFSMEVSEALSVVKMGIGNIYIKPYFVKRHQILQTWFVTWNTPKSCFLLPKSVSKLPR